MLCFNSWQDVFAFYDIDGGGTIDLDEFSHFLRQQYSEASIRIRDMTESLGMLVVFFSYYVSHGN